MRYKVETDPSHEFRIRKMRNQTLYSVTEYYAGNRIMLVEDKLSFGDALKLAEELSGSYRSYIYS